MEKPDIMTTAIRVSATFHFTAPRIYTRALLLYKKSQDIATLMCNFLGFYIFFIRYCSQNLLDPRFFLYHLFCSLLQAFFALRDAFYKDDNVF